MKKSWWSRRRYLALVICKDHAATNLVTRTSRELAESPAQRSMDSVAPSFAVQKKLGVVCLALTCSGHCRAARRVQVYARNFSRGLYRCIHLHTTERSGPLFQRLPRPSCCSADSFSVHPSASPCPACKRRSSQSSSVADTTPDTLRCFL